jgi:diamine N-acetyltransferase
MAPRLEPVTPATVRAACALEIAPEQDGLVAPVAVSLAEAYVHPDTAWPRLIHDGDALVGFVMAAFDPANPVEHDRCCVWRLNIAAGRQGEGYGRFAVDRLVAEARGRGYPRLFVSWVPDHPHSPAKFWHRMGFLPTGHLDGDEVVGARDL